MGKYATAEAFARLCVALAIQKSKEEDKPLLCFFGAGDRT